MNNTYNEKIIIDKPTTIDGLIAKFVSFGE